MRQLNVAMPDLGYCPAKVGVWGAVERQKHLRADPKSQNSEGKAEDIISLPNCELA